MGVIQSKYIFSPTCDECIKSKCGQCLKKHEKQQKNGEKQQKNGEKQQKKKGELSGGKRKKKSRKSKKKVFKVN